MAASGRIAAGLERWCRAGRRKHKGRRDLRRQARLDPMARERVRAIEVSHRRFHVFPADVFHQGLDVPAVCIRPRGEATSQRVSARSEEHTSELQSLMRISYAVFCLKKNTKQTPT